MPKETGYILAIARGHNGGACLLKDGEIVFAIEEERFTRHKYDGGPFAAMMKVKEYTDKIDYLFVIHTQTLEQTAGKICFTGDDMYTGLARKLGLIERFTGDEDGRNHPQVVDLAAYHHISHAACSFYRSGFEDAVAVVIDGAGSSSVAEYMEEPLWLWEVESIIDCSYPSKFKTLYKHQGTRGPCPTSVDPKADAGRLDEEGEFISVISDVPGIVKVYEAITEYCGFPSIEAGKTMGLAPYGKTDPRIPPLFQQQGAQVIPLANRNFTAGMYPNGAVFSPQLLGPDFCDGAGMTKQEVTKLDSRRNMAYHLQRDSQQQVLELIQLAVKLSGKKNVVLSGGYGLNCVANYFYLDALREDGINLYVEPMSNDGGTAVGAALWQWAKLTGKGKPVSQTLYLGPEYNYTPDDIDNLAESFGATITDTTDEDIVDLITNKNIVTIFQGRSENGPRALGNRSILYDPTDPNGKDFVNTVKRREYFRPFAGTILAEDVHEWFDLKGMKDTPHMMYAVNCKEGVEEKIPSIIHVDGTCRIQTVTEEENPNYYKLIKAFKEKTGVPIVFNTSFNLGGDPLVETLEDGFETLKKSDIEYMYLPEHGKLVTITNKKL